MSDLHGTVDRRKLEAARKADKYISKNGGAPGPEQPAEPAVQPLKSDLEEDLTVHHSPEADKAVIARLAKMSALDFDRVAKDEAVALGVQLSTLKSEVKRFRRGSPTRSPETDIELTVKLEPWPEEVDGGALLDAIVRVAREYLVLPPGGAEAIALWSLFAHAHDAFNISPILGVSSPTHECGKTTLLILLEFLVPSPLQTSNVTPAPLFRAIEKWHPTLLVDEMDTFLGTQEELRGILNSGHNRRAAHVLRCEGESFEVRKFSTWCPKILAKIGKFPPTLYSRSIRIELQRKPPGVEVKHLREDRPARLVDLARQCVRWAQDNMRALKAADPEMPEALFSRSADNWRPLLAVADLAGADWPARARRVAAASCAKAKDETAAIVLLEDLRALFEARAADRLHSDDIVVALHELDDRPWSEWGKARRPISKHQLCEMLKPFGLQAKQLRIGAENKNGYELETLNPVFERYLSPDTPSQVSTSLQPLPAKALRGIQVSTKNEAVESQKARKPLQANECREVESQQGGNGEISPDYPELPEFLDRRRPADGDPFASTKDEKWGMK